MTFVFAYPPGVDDKFVTNMCLHLRPPYYLQQPSLEDPPTLPKAMSPGQSLKMPGDELPGWRCSPFYLVKTRP
jgi:hypothetical protein